MLVTPDEFELPVFVTDNIEELANYVGTKSTNIRSAISHAKKRKYKCRFKRIEFDADDEVI